MTREIPTCSVDGCPDRGINIDAQIGISFCDDHWNGRMIEQVPAALLTVGRMTLFGAVIGIGVDDRGRCRFRFDSITGAR